MKQLTNLDAKWTGWYNYCDDSSGSGGSEGGWQLDRAMSIESRHVENWKVMPCVTDRSGPQKFS